jgi:plasmid maintenance system killer protein
MIVTNIEYSTNFVKQLKALPGQLISMAINKEKIFRANPLHPSLRLHQLNGKLKNLWSLSVNNSYRIIFKRQTTGDIIFISIGRHDVYKNL